MKKVKVKINGNWVETVAINGSTSGFSYQSWLNYVAVRNRTKTTIEAGDIDVRTLTGTNSARYLFSDIATLTSVVLDFRLIQGSSCLGFCFNGCSSLTSVRINLASLSNILATQSMFLNANSVNTIILDGMSNTTNWAATNSATNFFYQANFNLVASLTINCDILPNLNLILLTSLNLASVVQVLGQLFTYTLPTAHTITFNRTFTGLSLSDYNLINNAVIAAQAKFWNVLGLNYSM